VYAARSATGRSAACGGRATILNGSGPAWAHSANTRWPGGSPDSAKPTETTKATETTKVRSRTPSPRANLCIAAQTVRTGMSSWSTRRHHSSLCCSPVTSGWGVRANRVDQLVLPIHCGGEVRWNEEGMHGSVLTAAGVAHRGPPGPTGMTLCQNSCQQPRREDRLARGGELGIQSAWLALHGLRDQVSGRQRGRMPGWPWRGRRQAVAVTSPQSTPTPTRHGRQQGRQVRCLGTVDAPAPDPSRPAAAAPSCDQTRGERQSLATQWKSSILSGQPRGSWVTLCDRAGLAHWSRSANSGGGWWRRVG
jgi:hypothetical protein